MDHDGVIRRSDEEFSEVTMSGTSAMVTRLMTKQVDVCEMATVMCACVRERGQMTSYQPVVVPRPLLAMALETKYFPRARGVSTQG